MRNRHKNKVKLQNIFMELKIGVALFRRNVNVSGISRQTDEHALMFFLALVWKQGNSLTSGLRQERMSSGESANSPELSYREERRFQDRS